MNIRKLLPRRHIRLFPHWLPLRYAPEGAALNKGKWRQISSGDTQNNKTQPRKHRKMGYLNWTLHLISFWWFPFLVKAIWILWKKLKNNSKKKKTDHFIYRFHKNELYAIGQVYYSTLGSSLKRREETLNLADNCQRASRAKTRGWWGGSIIEPCESTVKAEKISSDL